MTLLEFYMVVGTLLLNLSCGVYFFKKAIPARRAKQRSLQETSLKVYFVQHPTSVINSDRDVQ